MSKFDLHTSLDTTSTFTDDVDPMSTIANLADVMLVFACGLMMALITYWNVDISTVTEMLKEDEIAEVQSPEHINDELKANDGTSYIDMGRIYLDPTTGKYYMITEGGATPVNDEVANADNNGPEAAEGEGEVSSAEANQSSTGTANPSGVGEVDRSQGGD